VHRIVKARAVPSVLALDDGVAAHFVGRKLSRVVSSRPNAGAYDVRRSGGRVIEKALPVTRL
jgi:hypothetical protein